MVSWRVNIFFLSRVVTEHLDEHSLHIGVSVICLVFTRLFVEGLGLGDEAETVHIFAKGKGRVDSGRPLAIISVSFFIRFVIWLW